MAYTAQDLINDMLDDLGVIFAGDIPNGTESNACLRRLNDLQFSLDIQRLNINNFIQTSISAVAAMTFGDLGTIPAAANTVRPISINPTLQYAIGVGFAATMFPVKLVGVDEFRAMSADRATARIPKIAYYDSKYPIAQLFLYPDPSAFAAADSGRVLLDYWAKSSSITGAANDSTAYTLASQMDLPPGYLRMLRTALAAECAPMYEKQLGQTKLDQIMAEAKAAVRALNAPPYVGAAEDTQATGAGTPVPPDAGNTISR